MKYMSDNGWLLMDSNTLQIAPTSQVTVYRTRPFSARGKTKGASTATLQKNIYSSDINSSTTNSSINLRP